MAKKAPDKISGKHVYSERSSFCLDKLGDGLLRCTRR
jgi:hypothetical protein